MFRRRDPIIVVVVVVVVVVAAAAGEYEEAPSITSNGPRENGRPLDLGEKKSGIS
jgi:hypothetical protein